MGKGDNRLTPKTKKSRAQAKKKEKQRRLRTQGGDASSRS